MSKMTGSALVDFARSKIGTAYVYGMKGTVMTQANFNYLRNTYEKMVLATDRHKIGKVCVDCSGLISWACGVALGSSQWMNRATVKKPISTIAKAPIGALVWRQGHIGVYSGVKNGVPYYIAADGSAYGVREVPISKNSFTHWLLVHSVFEYEEDEEMVEKENIVVDGKNHEVSLIRKDGVTYIKSRDIAELLGYEISSEGRMPVFTKE